MTAPKDDATPSSTTSSSTNTSTGGDAQPQHRPVLRPQETVQRDSGTLHPHQHRQDK